MGARRERAPKAERRTRERMDARVVEREMTSVGDIHV